LKYSNTVDVEIYGLRSFIIQVFFRGMMEFVSDPRVTTRVEAFADADDEEMGEAISRLFVMADSTESVALRSKVQKVVNTPLSERDPFQKFD
jgi:hypothetical protein